jgi:nucleotide-binding universal stress UspA family protein
VSGYRTVVVGTDGSESSLRAVGRAGALAGACDATLVVACAYLPPAPTTARWPRWATCWATRPTR